MPCPKCGSHRLWDDNLAWGCRDCPWFTTGEVRNKIVPADHFEDPVADHFEDPVENINKPDAAEKSKDS